jgi:hypothetical protein
MGLRERLVAATQRYPEVAANILIGVVILPILDPNFECFESIIGSIYTPSIACGDPRSIDVFTVNWREMHLVRLLSFLGHADLHHVALRPGVRRLTTLALQQKLDKII